MFTIQQKKKTLQHEKNSDEHASHNNNNEQIQKELDDTDLEDNQIYEDPKEDPLDLLQNQNNLNSSNTEDNIPENEKTPANFEEGRRLFTGGIRIS